MPQFPHSKYSSSPSCGTFVRAQGSHSPLVEFDSNEAVAVFDPDHPFKVRPLSFTEVSSVTTFKFSLSVGHIFGTSQSEIKTPWSTREDSINVGIGNLTETPAGVVSPGELDERNVGTIYSQTVSTTEDNVLYVKVYRTTADDYWEATLQLKTVSDAEAEYSTDPIECQYNATGNKAEELVSSPFYHPDGNRPPFDTKTIVFSGTQGNTFTFNLEQRGTKYRATSSYVGCFQVPIAYMRLVGGKWEMRQVLRSDIFFPYALDVVTEYIDTDIQDITIEGSC